MYRGKHETQKASEFVPASRRWNISGNGVARSAEKK